MVWEQIDYVTLYYFINFMNPPSVSTVLSFSLYFSGEYGLTQYSEVKVVSIDNLFAKLNYLRAAHLSFSNTHPPWPVSSFVEGLPAIFTALQMTFLKRSLAELI